MTDVPMHPDPRVKLADTSYTPKHRRDPPRWWARVYELNAQGLGRHRIAAVLGRSPNAVKYALAAWERARKRPSRGGSTANRDYKRAMARAAARDQWDRDGRPGRIEDYYVKNKCL